MTYEECCGYFVTKFNQWGESGNIESYVSCRDSETLCRGFQNDNAFKTIICDYISRVAEHEKSVVMSDIIRSTFTPPTFSLPSTLLNLLVVAALKACGREKQSSDLSNAVIIGTIVLVGIGIGWQFWKNHKK